MTPTLTITGTRAGLLRALELMEAQDKARAQRVTAQPVQATQSQKAA